MNEQEEKTYTLYEDSGHAWLEVQRRELTDMEIMNEITGYSYESGDSVFLEEDLDATTFIRKYESIYNKKPNIKISYVGRESAIRSYKGFCPKTFEELSDQIAKLRQQKYEESNG